MLSYIVVSAKNMLNCFVRADGFCWLWSSFDLFLFLSHHFFRFAFSFPPLSMKIIEGMFAYISHLFSLVYISLV